MNEDTQRKINELKYEMKDFTLTEILDFILPVIQRFYEVTGKVRGEERMLDWEIQIKETQVKKLVEDKKALEHELKETKKVIDLEREKAMEEVGSLKAEAKAELAEARKKKREAEVIKEEMEKKEFVTAQ